MNEAYFFHRKAIQFVCEKLRFHKTAVNDLPTKSKAILRALPMRCEYSVFDAYWRIWSVATKNKGQHMPPSAHYQIVCDTIAYSMSPTKYCEPSEDGNSRSGGRGIRVRRQALDGKQWPVRDEWAWLFAVLGSLDSRVGWIQWMEDRNKPSKTRSVPFKLAIRPVGNGGLWERRKQWGPLSSMMGCSSFF